MNKESPSKQNMGKNVVTVLSLILLLLGIYLCYTGQNAVGPRRFKNTGEYPVVPGGYIIFLSVFLFVGYRLALYKKKKDDQEY